MKKMVSISLVLVLFALCAAGCQNSPDAKKSFSVGVIQLTQHPALDAATEGFKAALKDALGDAVTVNVQNAAGEANTCATIANSFVSSGVDLIMANATPALQAAASATDKIPVVATSITDFASALDLKNWNGTTGINVTGTADLAPISQQADILKELFPDVKKVGILFCSAESNSRFQVGEMEECLNVLGIAFQEFSVADTNEVQAAVTAACAACDVLYIPTDNTMADSAAIIDSVAQAAKIPIVCGEENLCKGCGVATLSISYYDIGFAAGLMAAEILRDGTDPAKMPIQYAADLTKEFVKSRCDALGITVPDSYKAIAE